MLSIKSKVHIIVSRHYSQDVGVAEPSLEDTARHL